MRVRKMVPNLYRYTSSHTRMSHTRPGIVSMLLVRLDRYAGIR